MHLPVVSQQVAEKLVGPCGGLRHPRSLKPTFKVKEQEKKEGREGSAHRRQAGLSEKARRMLPKHVLTALRVLQRVSDTSRETPSTGVSHTLPLTL